jgi:hypothetical protein
MDFRIQGLDPAPFQALYGLPDGELAARGARRYRADAKPGFPDRVELVDAEPGETVLLVNHVHRDAGTPYRASHAVFVKEGALSRYDRVNEVPESLRSRTLSVRAFDAHDMMVDADLVDGRQLEALIASQLGREDVASIDVHYAKRGCFACRVTRG